MIENSKKRKVAVAGLVIAILLNLGLGYVAAQNTQQPVANEAPYYDNESGKTNTTDWVPGNGNVTATGMLDMISRVPGMLIGTGDVDPSGSGYEGVLLTGLVISAGALAATMGIGIGIVAGSMLGMVLAYGMTVVGIIPGWIQPLLLFAIVGIPAAVAMLRVFRR